MMTDAENNIKSDSSVTAKRQGSIIKTHILSRMGIRAQENQAGSQIYLKAP